METIKAFFARIVRKTVRKLFGKVFGQAEQPARFNDVNFGRKPSEQGAPRTGDVPFRKE